MPTIIHTDYYSHHLGRSLDVEITGHYGYPVLMFPTSQGSFTQNNDFGLNTSILNLTDSGKIKLYNIQTIDADTFYDKSILPAERIYRYELYMRFLAQEYIPYLQEAHQTEQIATAGASLGGYHAANLAFRFPQVVSHLICLSAAFSIRDFMGGYSDDLVYFNSPREFVINDNSEKYKHQKIILSTSNEDICLNQTREMAGILAEKGINHWYDEQYGLPHDWPLWRMVFPKFMNTLFA